MLDAFISIYFYNTMRKKVNRQKRMEYLLIMRYKKGGVHKLHDQGDARHGGQQNYNKTIESLPIVN